VQVVAGDLTDPESFSAAAQGVAKVFLIMVDGGAAGIRRALPGVGHVVVVSGRNATEEFDNPLRAKYVEGEAAVRASDVPATVLRPNAFASLARHWAPGIRAGGVVPTPFPELAVPVIDPADVADVAVAALVDDRHVGRTHVLSGPAALTVRERVAVIGEVTGRPLRVEPVGAEEYVRRISAHLDESFARAVTAMDQHFAACPPTVVPTVRDVLGRPARSFRSWVVEHAAAFMPG
jgi:uncharacterized protein YbjT (DUF2867 family)